MKNGHICRMAIYYVESGYIGVHVEVYYDKRKKESVICNILKNVSHDP